jgi:hypothetical protein
MQNLDPSTIESCIFEDLLIQINILGGSIDIEVTEETVIAFGLSLESLLDIILTE